MKGTHAVRRYFRLPAILAAALAAVILPAAPAWAGSPHFVGTPTVTTSGATITVTAKEAGLGGEAQIVAVLSGTAQCVNPGNNAPAAANKASFAVTQTEPVQNGQASYTITATAAFSPSCDPPMTVVFTSATLADTTNGLAVTLIPAG